MSRMHRLRKRSEIEGATSEELCRWLILARGGNDQAEHWLMCALTPLLTTFYTRRLTIGQDDLDHLIRETLNRVKAEQGRYDARGVFGKWLFDIARRTMLEHLDRRARLAVFELEARTISAEYRVLPERSRGRSSMHPRFWE